MKTKAFTLFVVPDRNGVSRRFRVSQKAVYAAALLALCGFGLMAAFMVHYTYVVSEVFEANSLRRQNKSLVLALNDLEEQMAGMEHALASLEPT